MNHLPTEVVDKIVFQVSLQRRLAPLATISKLWRVNVEYHLFRSLYLRTRQDWDTFVQYMLSKERRKSVRQLGVRLPGESNESLYWQGLATGLMTAFAELDSWGDDLAVVTLQVYFPSHPIIDLTATEQEIDAALIQCGIPYTDLTDYFPKGYAIPVWHTVRRLAIWGNSHRVSVMFFRKWAKAYPNLVSWQLQAEETTRQHPELILESRRALFEDPSDISSSLKDLEVEFAFYENEDQTITPNNYMIDGLDVFSACSRNISRNLTRFTLQASHLSPELFWPQQSQNTSQQPFWPNLVQLFIGTGMECATGQYMLLGIDKSRPYFKYWDNYVDDHIGYTGEDIQTRDPIVPRRNTHRIRPCHNLFDDLSIAMAKAMKQMPRLQTLTYKTDGFGIGPVNDSSDFGVVLYHDTQDTNTKTHMDWVFACNMAQLFDWSVPDLALDLLHQRWGTEFDISYVTNGECEGRNWIRSTSGGEEIEADNLHDIFEKCYTQAWGRPWPPWTI